MATTKTAMSSSKDSSSFDAAKRARARGRWKLLQQALLSRNQPKSNNKDDDDDDDHDAQLQQHYSKRSFPGYQMLESRIIGSSSFSDDDESNNEWMQKLQWIDTFTTDEDSANIIRSDIECSVLAIHALRMTMTTTTTTTTTTNQQQRRKSDANSHNKIDLFMDTDPQILLKRIMGGGGTSWLKELPALHPIVRDVDSGAHRDDNDNENHGRWRLTFHLGRVETDEHEPSPSPTVVGGTANSSTRQPQYCVREYRLPAAAPGASSTSGGDNLPQRRRSIIITRERMVSAHTKLSLQELVSHRNNGNGNKNKNQNGGGGVDNTGNICVWDCALTLAWALQQQQQQQQQQRQPKKRSIVLELGAGMAAISAFSLAVTAPSSLSTKTYVTDGHPDCVHNNRVNVRLLQAAGLLPSRDCNKDDGKKKVEVECRQMLWTTDSPPTTSSSAEDAALLPAADTTLIADCTHFQEYHAALFWTAVRHTSAKGGQIWMCQPERGNSLERFLALIRAVNDNSNGKTNSAAPLLRVIEQQYPELDAKHQEFLKGSSSNNHYDPNLHRPRIFVLTKERLETEQDRLCAIRHVQERDRDTLSTS